MHTVAWGKICSAKDEGGLGLKSLEERNKPFPLKWWSRYYSERFKLWNMILKGKYGS